MVTNATVPPKEEKGSKKEKVNATKGTSKEQKKK